MEKPEKISDQLQHELESLSASPILDPVFRRKKLVIWAIRNTITAILYIIFWKYEWVRWTLFLGIPLALFSLLTITLFPWLLQKKMNRARKSIQKLEDTLGEGNE